ncbi:MAG TPA: hypothetical protein VLA54_09900 [Acidimicrobiia bacterium]|nr:hypothetical protein [Acidimicrobiia bacterium]
MSELLAAAAAALSAPEAIVQRSAEARAKAGGLTTDEVLAAWAGGAPAPRPASPSMPAAASAPVTAPPSPPGPAPITPGAAPMGTPPPSPVAPAPVPATPIGPSLLLMEPEEAEPVEPLAVGERMKSAARIGAITGSVLGVIGALVASPWLLPAASLAGSEGDYSPAVLVETSRFLLATALFSIGFGLIVATLSRTMTGWLSPGSALIGRGGVTRLIGAGSGLVLGLVAGSVLTSAFGLPVEGTEGMVSLPIMSALIVVLLGGALLGAVTAALVQMVGIPAGVAAAEATEVDAVRSRLAGAISVPLAGVLALGLLVIPFAVVLIRSNHMASGGAAILAVIAAASVLVISGLSASRPGMKISRSEFLLALGGIGVVLLIIVAVLLARRGPGLEEVVPPPAEAAVVLIV